MLWAQSTTENYIRAVRVSMSCGKARTCRMWDNCDSSRVFVRITFPYSVGFRFSHCLMDLIWLAHLVFQFTSSMDASFSAEKKKPRILTTSFMSMSWISSIKLLVSWCFKPSKLQRIISGLRETFIKRYVVERTNKAKIRPEEQWEIGFVKWLCGGDKLNASHNLR